MFTVWCDLVALNFKKARLCQGRHIRLRLVRVKVFSERKMFSCVWLHFKKCFGKYFLMFGCVLENTIENTFSTCLLIFSHIFSITKWIYNIIHSSKHKQNPEKNHQIRTNIARSRLAHRGNVFAVPVMSSFAFVISSFFLPLSFSLSLSLFYFPRPEVIWSENGNGNDFPLFWLWNSVNWKCFSVWPNLK